MKSTSLIPAVSLLLLAGCLQDPDATVAPESVAPMPSMIVAGNAVFMASPYSETVVKILPGEQGSDSEPYSELPGTAIQHIGIGENPGELLLTPDGNYLLALVDREGEGGLAVLSPSARCSGELPVDASCVTLLEGRALHDTLTLSPDGRYAVSSLSAAGAATLEEDIVNLNEIGVYDLSDMSVRFVTVGYNPKGFAFTHGETNRRMVAITDTRVVLVDLETGDTTARDLTVSGGTPLHPTQALVTGDNHFALVTIEGSSDLFTFDLSQASLPINIINLGGTPRLLQLSADGSEALVLYNDHKKVGIIHQEDLSIDLFSLDDSVTRVRTPEGMGYAIFYDDTGNGRTLYYLDLESERMVSYHLDNPCAGVEVSPAGDALVLYYRPAGTSSGQSLSSGYAVAILNLGQGDRAPTPILVHDMPRGAVFRVGVDPTQDEVYVAFDGVDSGTVGRFNLYSYDSMAIDVAPRPYAIAALSDGRIVTAHASPLGWLSIFPMDRPEAVQFVRGFLTDGLL